MKIFNTVDEKLSKIGFDKAEDNDYSVVYFRQEHNPDYKHEVVLMHKASGRHILQSYDPNLADDKCIGNTCAGLTYRELKLFLKKMKQKGWNG